MKTKLISINYLVHCDFCNKDIEVISVADDDFNSNKKFNIDISEDLKNELDNDDWVVFESNDKIQAFCPDCRKYYDDEMMLKRKGGR
jgi:hypothetical protein